MTFGITPAGFKPKRLADILVEREAAEQTKLGTEVDLSPSSPLGQLNSVTSDFEALIWALAESVYNSNDPRSATGARLRQLAKIRGLPEILNETDYDLVQRIINRRTSKIATRTLHDRMAAVAGITWLSINYNNSATDSPNGLPARALSIAAVGGSNLDIAIAISASTSFGSFIHGNTKANSDAAGICSPYVFTRPVEVPIAVEISLSEIGSTSCSISDQGAIKNKIAENFKSAETISNGALIDMGGIIAALYGLGGLTVECALFAKTPNTLDRTPVQLSIFERPTLDVSNISIVMVDVGVGCSTATGVATGTNRGTII